MNKDQQIQVMSKIFKVITFEKKEIFKIELLFVNSVYIRGKLTILNFDFLLNFFKVPLMHMNNKYNKLNKTKKTEIAKATF